MKTVRIPEDISGKHLLFLNKRRVAADLDNSNNKSTQTGCHHSNIKLKILKYHLIHSLTTATF